jgi:hypothetical protein
VTHRIGLLKTSSAVPSIQIALTGRISLSKNLGRIHANWNQHIFSLPDSMGHPFSHSVKVMLK